MRLTRQQVIAYRVAAQGLMRDGSSADKLAVLDIGVQDTAGSAALALDARLAKPTPVPQSLALAWTLRGAPHLHWRRDLDRLAAALYPLSDADALARVDASAGMRKAGIAGLDGFRIAVDALRRIVTAPTGKGAASAALTRATPDGMHRYCRSCRATHVFEMVLRLPTLAAGIELEPDTAPPVLVPRKGAAMPDGPDVAALQALVRAYLTCSVRARTPTSPTIWGSVAPTSLRCGPTIWSRSASRAVAGGCPARRRLPSGGDASRD